MNRIVMTDMPMADVAALIAELQRQNIAFVVEIAQFGTDRVKVVIDVTGY